jgi:rhamnopyranosyl-N-acetylglucosaminyl-diphospho-decaprenol beta-1,3/1,4-galactofuranosyltransferase
VSERVCAVVVTYNRVTLLRECLAALYAQTLPVDHVLVVNNASTDKTNQVVSAEFAHAQLLNLPENVGGAGGFHEGMKWAFEHGYDWIWIMDDDGRPAPDCLQQLMRFRQLGCVLIPVERNSAGVDSSIGVWRGRVMDVSMAQANTLGHFLFAFVGPLLPRQVIARAGLPIKEFFIWFDDVEYALRLKRLGLQNRVIDRAVMHHNFGQNHEVRFLWRRKIRVYHPPWKVYYGARNALYTLTRLSRDQRSLRCYFLDQFRYLLGDLLYEKERWTFVRMRLRGMWDGALGRLGKLV